MASINPGLTRSRDDCLGAFVLRNSAVWMVGVWFFVIQVPAADEASLATPELVLTNAAQVRALTPVESKRGYPVRIRGTVTYADFDWDMMFVQDTTSGIYLMRSDVRTQLEPGQQVDVEGFSHPGSFTPIITRARVTPGAKVALPHAARISFEDFATGK